MKKIVKVMGPIKKRLINLLYRLSSSDITFMRLVQKLAMKNTPMAVNHLNHYLFGQASEKVVKISDLFDHDQGVKLMFFKRIQEAINRGCENGEVTISQFAYTNKEWLYSLGGIKIQWYRRQNKVRAWFVNKYRWHPNDERITQAIHRAAENLKLSGAQDYFILGLPETILVNDIMNQGGVVSTSRATLYLL